MIILSSGPFNFNEFCKVLKFVIDTELGDTNEVIDAERQAELRMHALSPSTNAMMATRASCQPNFGGYNSGDAKHVFQGSSSRPYNDYTGSQFRSSPQSGKFKSPGYHGSRFYSGKHGSNSFGFKQ